jgi:hypothetical protein
MRRKSEEERIVSWFRSADLPVVEVLLRVLQQLVRERQIDAGGGEAKAKRTRTVRKAAEPGPSA